MDELDFIINLHYNEAPEFYKIYKKHELTQADKLLNKYNHEKMPRKLQFAPRSYIINRNRLTILEEMQQIIHCILKVEEFNFIYDDAVRFQKQLEELEKNDDWTNK